MRNAIALGRWLLMRAGIGAQEDVYSGAFWEFHAGGDWPGFANVVLQFCTPASVVDVGCGDAKLLAALQAATTTLPLLGIDSSPVAAGRATRSGVTVERHDLASTRRPDRARLRERIAAFDVAISLETAEHLPPWSAASFVRALAASRIVVFSAAQPGQGGTLHMNERPPAYWQAQFRACGLDVASFDVPFRAAIAALDLPWWYAANIHVFERRR
jgi:hypothetical protein